MAILWGITQYEQFHSTTILQGNKTAETIQYHSNPAEQYKQTKWVLTWLSSFGGRPLLRFQLAMSEKVDEAKSV